MNVFQHLSIFLTLLTARFISARYLHITDCDETYNYWEPLHYLVNGKGLQTWEYSPEFGLRSYLYLILHAVPTWIAQKFLLLNATSSFYSTRFVLAVVCAALETAMFSSIRKNFGSLVSKLWLIFQLVSPGMYISSVALLPSTFSMYLTMLLVTSWWQRNFKLAILSVVLSTFIGWPFAAVLSLPFVYTLLVQHKRIKLFLVSSVVCAVAVGVPLAVVDSKYYGKFTLAPLNIVLYNIFTSHGPNLYGVESNYFYFINLFLNFNVVWLLALVWPLLILMNNTLHRFSTLKIEKLHWSTFWKTSPLYIWMLVFFMQPHKEERFMFPVYPIITLCAALTINIVLRIQKPSANKKNSSFLANVIETLTIYGTITIFAILSISRILALYNYYHAPMDIAGPIEESPYEKNICLGKEWHRFPGSFFIPANDRIRFVKSHFNGILPAYFDESEGGSTKVHKHFNNLNKANSFMLFDIAKCHYMIDLDTGKDYSSEDAEPNYAKDTKTWQVVQSIPFLEANKSHALFRAFYVPWFSKKYLSYGNYRLLKRKNK